MTIRDACLAPGRTIDAPTHGALYSRMFPQLVDHEPGDDVTQLEAAGRPGGICDATPAIARLGHQDDSNQAAGWPFFGQLIAHDITADRSPIGSTSASLHNARSPRIDLEMIYGDAPIGNPYLIDRDDPAKMLLGPDGQDLPRNHQGIALIGDPRNDVHLFVAALHTALLRAHNTIVDRLRDDGVPEDDLFQTARVSLTWHFQWMTINDFLPRLIGPDLVQQLLANGNRWYRPDSGNATIPVEFADGAYRYGHGQIRHRYQLVANGTEHPLFPDLAGFGPLAHHLDWRQIFDFPSEPPAQRAKRLDGTLPASLIQLPTAITGPTDDDTLRSLAARDLIRGHTTRLPTGEQIAELLGLTPVDNEATRSWFGHTPLWLYTLIEANEHHAGNQLGPVAATIVGEVLIGLVTADPNSYLRANHDWQPTLPKHGPTFELTDLLELSTEDR